MERSKLANGNGHGAQIGRSAYSAQQDQMSAVRSAGKEGGPEEDGVEKS